MTKYFSTTILIWLIIIVLLTIIAITNASCFSLSNPPSQPSVPPTVLQESVRGLSSLSWWLILGVGISVFGFLNGSKWGIPAAVACIAALSLNFAVLKYSTIVSIIGLCGAVGVSVYSLFIKGRGVWLEKNNKDKK